MLAACRKSFSQKQVLGANFTVADLNMYAVVSSLRKGFFDHVPADYDKQWPAIGAMVDALEADETFAPYKL